MYILNRPERTDRLRDIQSSDSAIDNDYIGQSIFCWGGARGVMVVVAGIGHGDTSSNPGLIVFHIALIPLGKV